MRPPRDYSDEQTGHSALDWAVRTQSTDWVRQEMAAALHRRRRRIVATSSVLALALVSTLTWRSLRPVQPSAPALLVQPAAPTFVSRPLTTTLSDGTTVELKEGSRIEPHFTDQSRRVTLLSGQALFHVTHHADRPFIVTAGNIEATDIGTAFSVQLQSSAVEVLVTEGQVSVDSTPPTSPRSSAASSAPVLVLAGNKVVMDRAQPDAKPEPVTSAAIAEKLSWTVPMLHLSGTPLSEVLPVFNQYSHTPIVLSDPSLGSLQLSGTLRADNLSSFLGILDLQFGLQADTSEHQITLHKK